MKIATLTLNIYQNYGNTLQKYALYRSLKKFTDSVEVLWTHCNRPYYPYTLELNHQSIGNLRDATFRGVREYRFKAFDDANIQTRFDFPYLEDVADEYDFFIVGSDQVWNPQFKFPERFLEFAPHEKRIAYAASIAIPKLPEEVKETYRQKISEIPYVSIREKEGCDLVEKLTGKRPIHLQDPVFLLTSNEWREIAKRPAWLNQKKYDRGYVLSYFFEGKAPKQVYSLAAKLDLPVINLLDIKNFNHYITSVEEFLYLIDHATIVCTLSFHATAFSSIFKKPFIVYLSSSAITGRFTRVGSLLNLFNLSDRVTDAKLNIKVADPMKIDFTRCDEVLPLERAKAFKFLSEALGTEPREKILEVTHDEN